MRQPSEFAEPAARFRAAGYRVEVAVLAVPEALSRLGILDRYSQQVQKFGYGRVINSAVHDACYEGVLRETEAIDRGDVVVDAVSVFRRGPQTLSTNQRGRDGRWKRTPDAKETVIAERARAWTQEESGRSRQDRARDEEHER